MELVIGPETGISYLTDHAGKVRIRFEDIPEVIHAWFTTACYHTTLMNIISTEVLFPMHKTNPIDCLHFVRTSNSCFHNLCLYSRKEKKSP